MHARPAAYCFLFAAMLAPCVAFGQIGRTVPDSGYYMAVKALYDGEYTRSARAFRREWQTSIRIGNVRWIDSICFHAMRGEALYQLGQNREALDEFNSACEMYLAHPTWMLRVQFQQDPRGDNNPRRVAPWGAPMRKVTYGRLPETMLIAFGKLDNSAAANQGGVVQLAQYWKIDVAEVVRCTALAIRRRNALLGPLGAHDKLSRELADTFARGGTAPANHWSGAWMDLLGGLAHLGVQKPQEAAPYLARAQLLDGRYDHQLTGAALLAQAQHALASGNGKLVPRLAREAALAAYAYEDWDVLCDAFALGHVYFLGSGGKKIDAPLPGAVAWADRQRVEHVTALLRLLIAEEYAADRQESKSATVLASAIPRRSDVSRGRLAPYAKYIRAMIELQNGKLDNGKKATEQALAGYSGLSLTNFQLSLTDERFDSGEVSPRVAVDVYQTLLNDPSPGHWALDPMDAMVSLREDQESSFQRWIDASLMRREILQAMYAADLAKRRRFLQQQPLGGRLLAIRRLVETPEAHLDAPQRLERQALLAQSEGYSELATLASDVTRDLAGAKALFSKETMRRDGEWFKELEKLTAKRELALRELALRRTPSEIAFPPRRSAEDSRDLLAEGDAMLVFHQSGDALHAFLLAKQGEHVWPLPEALAVQGQVGDLLQAIGNHSGSKALSAKEAASDQWRKKASALGDLLLKNSRLDLKLTKRLVIVPDGPLWHLPFEVLEAGEPGNRQLIREAALVRYAPTMGLALGDNRDFRPVRHTGIAMPRPAGGAAEREMQEMAWNGLNKAAPTALRLPNPAPVASSLVAGALDSLVVLVETTITPKSPYQWQPLPIDRGRNSGSLAQWMELPVEGPERLILSGVHTAAENGLKGARRRGSRSVESRPLGSEMFHAACGLMSSGGRTILISRWQTGGGVQRQLVQEFATGWTTTSAADAWRRSVSLASAARLDAIEEPRYKPRGSDATDGSADHPFFWAGFMLLDTGYEPPTEAPPAVEAPAKKAGE